MYSAHRGFTTFSSHERGFTLIELLVTISIIAILATIGATIFSNTQKEAQNSRRKADIVAIAKAMENKYSAVVGTYQELNPDGSDFAGGVIPLPPEGGTYASILGTGATGFRICTSLVDNTQTQCTANIENVCFCEESEQGTYVATGYITPINGYGTPGGGYSTPAYGTPAYGTPAYGTPAYGTPYATPPTNTPTPTPGSQILGDGDPPGPNGTGFPHAIFSSKYQMPAGQNGTAVSMSVYIANVTSTSPNNQYQMAIYADNGSNRPGNLLAQTSTGTMLPNQWNTTNLISQITLTAGTTYWLGYNTNTNAAAPTNEFTYDAGSFEQFAWVSSTFGGTWPNPFGAPQGILDISNSIYVTYTQL